MYQLQLCTAPCCNPNHQNYSNYHSSNPTYFMESSVQNVTTQNQVAQIAVPKTATRRLPPPRRTRAPRLSNRIAPKRTSANHEPSDSEGPRSSRRSKKWTAIKAECDIMAQRVKQLDEVFTGGHSQNELLSAIRQSVTMYHRREEIFKLVHNSPPCAEKRDTIALLYEVRNMDEGSVIGMAIEDSIRRDRWNFETRPKVSRKKRSRESASTYVKVLQKPVLVELPQNQEIETELPIIQETPVVEPESVVDPDEPYKNEDWYIPPYEEPEIPSTVDYDINSRLEDDY